MHAATRCIAVAGLVAALVAPDARASERGRLGSPWAVHHKAPVSEEPPRRMIRGPSDPTAVDGTDPRRREAARAFADGEAAFDRGDFDDAAERFARAHALSPHPWTLYNHAVSLRQAGRPVEAWRAFAELEATAGSDEERTEARREQAALRGRIAIVDLAGPAGAPVCIDRELLRLGRDGRGRWVGTAGTHRLWSHGPPRTFTVVAGDDTRLEVRPPPRKPSASQRRARGWLVTAIVGSSLGLGGSAAAAALADDRRVQALAGTAAVASTAALVAAIVVLAQTERAARRRRPDPLPCELVAG